MTQGSKSEPKQKGYVLKVKDIVFCQTASTTILGGEKNIICKTLGEGFGARTKALLLPTSFINSIG